MSESIKLDPEHQEGQHDHHDHHHEETFWSKYVFSVDHKMIGLQYFFTGVAMLLALISVLTLLPKLILILKPFGNG